MAEVETTVKTNTYEGLFLLDAGQSFDAAAEPIRKVMDRSGAEVLVCKLWDERRLAYEIKGRKRGLYILTYFRLDPLKLVELEHDVLLTEEILRALFIRKDALTEEEMNADTPATGAEAGLHESAGPSDEEDQARPRDRKDHDDEAGSEDEVADVEDVETLDDDESDEG
jgi:small subunit ribosomal protein S6